MTVVAATGAATGAGAGDAPPGVTPIRERNELAACVMCALNSCAGLREHRDRNWHPPNAEQAFVFMGR